MSKHSDLSTSAKNLQDSKDAMQNNKSPERTLGIRS